MSKRHPDDPTPTWFRLSDESWAMIRDEYLSGVTARVLAKKYRTSPSSIYRHACAQEWTKEKLGDVIGRRHGASGDAEAASAAAAPDAAEQAAEVAEKRALEAELAGKFRYAAFLAYVMVHDPASAPAIFVDAIAQVRRDAFGEGDDESIAQARRTAEAARRYFRLDEAAWRAAFESGV